ncbi:MAG: protein kinase [Gammaproteobacteria bacterium]|nr:protein kinase [Gammaproteobacteria bacterium]MCP5458977.1 protein kinase [Gammaproteobacteria bacterium]
MATVYLATQEALSRLVALKVVAPALAADSQFAQRFLNEGKYVAQLSHQNIITIFDCGSFGNYYYLSMEYLPGGTLEDRIDQGLPLPEALEVAKAIASALGYAHIKGFVHRDVKPLNILFRKEGTPVLTDFGVAKFMESSGQLTAPGMALGSLRFMSPEQVTGQEIDSRSDLYSLGIVFHKMLTGRLPYEAEDPLVVAVMHSTAPLPILTPEYAKFQPVLDKLLAKDREERFQKAEEFIQAITRIQRGQPPFEENLSKALSVRENLKKAKQREEIDATREYHEPGSPTHRNRWLGWAVGGLVLAAMAGGYLALDLPLPGSGPGTSSTSPIPDGENSLQKIAGYYQQQAEQLFQQGKVSDSLIQIDNGLRVQPNHPGLLALRDRIRKELAQKSAQQVEVARRASELKQLLAEAEQHLGNSRFTEPADDNAYQLYQRVLAMDPGNQQARDGLRRIADHFQQEAQQALERKQWREGLARVEEGLKIVPEHPGLMAVRGEIQKAQEQAQIQTQIEGLLAEAARHWNENQLTQPPGGNAYENYQQVLRLDPQNAAANQGVDRLANFFLTQARQLQQEGQLNKSMTQIEEGLRVRPQAEALMALREQVGKGILDEQSQRAEAQRRQANIQQLLMQAQQYRQQSQFIQPPGSNAYDAYQEVLKLDSSNAQARQGIAWLAQQFQEQARQLQQQGQLEQSLDQLQQGLKVEPENQEMLALHDQIQGELDQRRAASAETERRHQEIDRLLGQAEQQLKAQPLTLSAVDGSYASYQAVLKLDPNNDSAQRGVKQLGDAYRQVAEQQRQQGDFQASLASIDKGLGMAPGQSALQALRQAVEAQFAEAQKQALEDSQRQKITQLLEQAEQQLEQNKLTLPVDNNAFATYQQVLQLDPQNEQAKQGFDKIADRYQVLAESYQQRGDFTTSLSNIEKGLSVAPNHAGLLALREKVQASLAEAEKQRKEDERQRAEDERRRQADAARQQAEDARRRQADRDRQEDQRRQAVIEQQKKDAEARRQADIETQKRAAEEARRNEQAEQRRQAELARRRAEEAARQAELERRRAEEKQRMQEQEQDKPSKPRLIGTF